MTTQKNTSTTRTALVTGASVGIGEAVVRRLAGQGWQVLAAARRVDRLEQLAEECGPAVKPLALDVSDAKATHAALSQLPAPFDRLDLLVNNAGLALGREPAHEAQLADWETMVQTNVLGLLRCTHALLPGMVARGSGTVINIGSIAGRFPYPGGHVYGATKAFVNQFTLGLKADLAGTGVRATVIEPGMVGGSEFSLVRFGGDQAKAGAIYAGMDTLTPEDIAEAVSWVAQLPKHVDITVMQMMPVDQGPGPMRLVRREG